MATTWSEDGSKKERTNKNKGHVASGGKLTRGEYGILRNGLKSKPAGKAYDKELIRLQNLYPNYFPKA